MTAYNFMANIIHAFICEQNRLKNGLSNILSIKIKKYRLYEWGNLL